MRGKKMSPAGVVLLGIAGVVAACLLAGLILILMAAVPVFLLHLESVLYQNGAGKPHQLIFENESHVSVAYVIVESDDDQKRLQFGNGNLLEEGEDWRADWEAWPCTVTAYDAEGEAIAALTVDEEPEIWANYRYRWYVTLVEGTDGLLLAQTPVETDDYEDRLEFRSSDLNVDISEGTVIHHCGMPRGWQGDGEDFMTIVFSAGDAAMLEESFAHTEGWRPLSEMSADTGIFCGTEPQCGHSIPPVEDGWYFFRNHNAEGDDRWKDSGTSRIDLIWNCTAAIYDPMTRTLYLFDHDM